MWDMISDCIPLMACIVLGVRVHSTSPDWIGLDSTQHRNLMVTGDGVWCVMGCPSVK